MGLTRRRLLEVLPGLAAGFCLEAEAQRRIFLHKPRPAAPTMHPAAFFGTDTHRGGKGVYGTRFDPATGQFATPMLMVPGVRASWMALNPARDRRVVYLTDEGDERTSGVVTCAFDPVSGMLHTVDRVSSGAAGPTYLAVDPTGQSVFTADSTGGAVAGFKVRPDGSLSAPVTRVDLRQESTFGHHGPDRKCQDAAHPHAAIFSPSDRFLVVADLGTDALVTFPVDAATAQLGPPHVVHTRRAGAGPRHLVFHPNQRWVYCVNELASTVDQYLWNTVHGAHGISDQALLTDTARAVDTVAAGFSGRNTAAEIVLEPEGRFLYVSNRGEDSVAVFSVDQASGALSPVQRIASGGRTPCHTTLDQTGRWLVVGNLESSTVTVFHRDVGTGRLTGPVQTLAIESPMVTLFV